MGLPRQAAQGVPHTAIEQLQAARKQNACSRTCCVEEVCRKLGAGLGSQEGHRVLVCVRGGTHGGQGVQVRRQAGLMLSGARPQSKVAQLDGRDASTAGTCATTCATTL